MKTKNKQLEAIIEKYDLVNKNLHYITNKVINTGFTPVEILEYINQHYAIKPDVMRELKKDENVRRILEGKVELEVGKWYKVENTHFLKFLQKHSFIDDNEGYGFDMAGMWSNSNFGLHDAVLATPEEIQSMLVKKLEADGLKVGCRVERNFASTQIVELVLNGYRYEIESDALFFGGVLVYSKGKFAKIIQPELTIEQRLERLEKHLKID